MLTKENRVFSSLDFFTILFTLSIIAYIATPIVNRTYQTEGIEKAQLDIAQISTKLLLPPVASLDASNGLRKSHRQRGIASVVESDAFSSAFASGKSEGDIGKDPWGGPYHFIFIKNAMGAQTHLAIWSDGPDQRPETDVKVQLSQNPTTTPHIAFQGDDLGSITPLR